MDHKAWETKFMFKSLLSKLVVLWDASLNYKVNNFAFKTMCKFGVRKVLFSLRIKSIILLGVSENTRNHNLPNDKGTQGVFFLILHSTAIGTLWRQMAAQCWLINFLDIPVTQSFWVTHPVTHRFPVVRALCDADTFCLLMLQHNTLTTYLDNELKCGSIPITDLFPHSFHFFLPSTTYRSVYCTCSMDLSSINKHINDNIINSI